MCDTHIPMCDTHIPRDTPTCTAYCIWSVISSTRFSNVNRCSCSLGFLTRDSERESRFLDKRLRFPRVAFTTKERPLWYSLSFVVYHKGLSFVVYHKRLSFVVNATRLGFLTTDSGGNLRDAGENLGLLVVSWKKLGQVLAKFNSQQTREIEIEWHSKYNMAGHAHVSVRLCAHAEDLHFHKHAHTCERKGRYSHCKEVATSE